MKQADQRVGSRQVPVRVGEAWMPAACEGRTVGVRTLECNRPRISTTPKERTTMADKGSEYQKHTDGNATVFNVTPSSPPKFTYLIVIGVIAVLFGLAMPGWVKLPFLLLGGLAIWWGCVADPRPKAHRQPSTFKVSPDAVEANGRTFQKDDIHRLLLRNGVNDEELLDHIATTTGQAAVQAQRERAARIAIGLTLESGGKSTLLAGGMNETTAYGLLHETSRILGFDVG